MIMVNSGLKGLRDTLDPVQSTRAHTYPKTSFIYSQPQNSKELQSTEMRDWAMSSKVQGVGVMFTQHWPTFEGAVPTFMCERANQCCFKVGSAS